MGIEIPKRLNDHLLKDNHWYGCVTSAKSKIEYFLSESPLFFPDYTGHGIDHINQVLIAADKLIRDDAFRTDVDKDEASGILDPMDLAYLICAIMIHDMGMFLKKDGAEKVINSACGRPIPRIGDDSWKNLWQDYFDSTHRSTQSAMRRQFGKIKSYSENCFAMDNMGEDERRFIGEFLRRHHGRLAHEIALRGLPGSTTIDIFDGCDLADSDREMIGILARSHTMAIRETEPYLKARIESGPMPGNTPVFFLMSVLRIADLLDAGDHRAPELLLVHQNIYVPASEEEWQWNQRIIKRKCGWEIKRKNRHIYAEPKCSVEYVQLDKWLKWVQSELDLCWSTLAECYPNGYRLSIHRVTSNIRQPDYYNTMTETFLPREVTVSANPEITQLLIAPLYGNDPSFGVRELLQNAVDACEERRYREPGYKGQVTIRIDPWSDPSTGENRGVFTIEDNGIGMNEHVLLNYYLSAGSSYRNSEEWKKEYSEGRRAQVARTGKFGVGFLASFLLGDEIEVHTQHISDELGYKFSFTNEAKPLNVDRSEREEGVGTTVRIQLKAGILDILLNQYRSRPRVSENMFPWHHWYAFDNPIVRYFINGDEITYSEIRISRDSNNNPGWFQLANSIYEEYIWNPQLLSHHSRRPFLFFSNGIRIYDIDNHRLLSHRGLGCTYPNVSLIDKDARLDLNLSRSIIQNFPDEELLAHQVFRYHIARLLLTNPDRLHSSNLRLDRFNKIPFIFTNENFQINNATVLSILQIEQVYFLLFKGMACESTMTSARHILPKTEPYCLCTDYSAEDFLRRVFGSVSLRLHFLADGYLPERTCNKFWVHGNYSRLVGESHRFVEDSSMELPNNLMQYRRIDIPSPNVPIPWEYFDPNFFPAVFQILNPNEGSDTLFAEVLREVLEPAPGYDRNDIWIPFDMEERRKKFPKAFRVLKEYIDAIADNPEAHHVNI